MKLVVDTSVLIDYLRGGSRWKEILSELEEGVEFYMPTIVIFELFAGESSKNSDKLKEIKHFLTFFTQIELNQDIAKRAGEIYRDISRTLDLPDYLIAASALEIGAQVLTFNIKHFKQIPGLKIYQ